jgi:hypothetical protein
MDPVSNELVVGVEVDHERRAHKIVTRTSGPPRARALETNDQAPQFGRYEAGAVAGTIVDHDHSACTSGERRCNRCG